MSAFLFGISCLAWIRFPESKYLIHLYMYYLTLLNQMRNPQTNNAGSNDVTIDFFFLNRKVFSIDWLFSDLRRFCFCLGSTIGCALGLRPKCVRTELECYALYTLIYNFLFIIWPGPKTINIEHSKVKILKLV
mgnify:CR=1 FL=1